MLAFQVEKRKLRSVVKPLPKLRPGWALVRVRLAGICNTDVEILRGYHNFRGTPGHEFVGEVALRTFDKAIALLRSSKVDLQPLITRTFPLAEARKAIAFAQQSGVMKVLLIA